MITIVSLNNFVIDLVSLPIYVNTAHFPELLYPTVLDFRNWFFCKDVNVNISYRTRNTICNILTTNKLDNNPYNESGVYQLKCQSCPKVYIGQTGRNFKTRFKEHVLDIKNKRSKTGFSHHILGTGHIYGNIEKTMEILNLHEKGNCLNTLDKFHIYKANKDNKLLKENYTDIFNPIFELIC
jgi:hypothetical protein